MNNKITKMQVFNTEMQKHVQNINLPKTRSYLGIKILRLGNFSIPKGRNHSNNDFMKSLFGGLL